MTTYRERREAKADRLREWADKRDVKAEAGFKRSNDIADMIPFGVENSRKAAEFRSRADNIEAAAEHAVYSDDDDASERLALRITEREAERDRIKAFNVAMRKGDLDLSLLDEKQKANYLSIVNNCPYQLGKKGEFPGYALSNLGATIRKDKKRLEALT